jgi:aminoglycoside phosphotransferase (APT) family kinase protein
MHADELEIDGSLVRRLLAEQFPDWADLPLTPVEHADREHGFRLGDDLAVRLARCHGRTEPGGKELEWLPRLASLLRMEIPIPVAQGQPAAEYPWYWDVPARDAFRGALPVDEATWERARGWALSQAVAILAYYTPENNSTLYREAESWLELALSE